MNDYCMLRFVKNIGERQSVLIEIQASIHHSIETKFNYMFLGKLTKLDETNYTLNIGNHQIRGKLIQLKNPYILCQKGKENGSEIKILQLLEQKILFDKRPTPLLKNMSKA